MGFAIILLGCVVFFMGNSISRAGLEQQGIDASHLSMDQVPLSAKNPVGGCLTVLGQIIFLVGVGTVFLGR